MRATGLRPGEASPVLDAVARAAARALGVPAAWVSLVEDERPWRPGVAGTLGAAAVAREGPPGHAYCRRVVATGGAVAVDGAYLGVPVTSDDGHVLGALAAASDAPRRWTEADRDALEDLAAAASAELRRAAHDLRFRLAVEATQDVVYTHDYRTGHVERHGAVEALYGQPAAALAPVSEAWLACVHPDDRARVAASWAAALAEGADRWRCEYRLLHPDGTAVVVEDRARLVRDPHAPAGAPEAARILAVAGALRDVTRERAADAALAASEARLRQAQKLEAVGQLAGGIAHDFNNLLTVVSANLEFLRGGLREALPPHHPALRDAAEIAEASERARALVWQLLAFSRKQPVQPRRVELAALVRGAERLLRRVIGEEITLVVDAGDAGGGPPDTHVAADPGQLEQALLNLAVNARDAMLTALHGHDGRGGTLTLAVDAVTLGADEASAWDGVAPGRWVRLRVRDTGHGMDEATRARVFEPFFTTKDVGAGTGLGLATVLGVVQQAGGAVRVDSAPGRGSAFTVLLPAAGPPAAGPPPPDPPPEAPRHPAPAEEPLPNVGATVLLVEDEPGVRSATRRLLERRGYAVREATNGAHALEVWRACGGAVDAVVTDVRMPALGGPELVARLRLERPTLPVVFVSGYADGVLARAPAGAAPEVLVDKPFTGDALLSALAAVLRPASG